MEFSLLEFINTLSYKNLNIYFIDTFENLSVFGVGWGASKWNFTYGPD